MNNLLGLLVVIFMPFLGAVASSSFAKAHFSDTQMSRAHSVAAEIVETANSHLNDQMFYSDDGHLKLLLEDKTFLIAPMITYCDYDYFILELLRLAELRDLSVSLVPSGKNPRKMNLSDMSSEFFESNLSVLCSPSDNAPNGYSRLKGSYHFEFVKMST